MIRRGLAAALLGLVPSLAFAQEEKATYQPSGARAEAGGIVFAGTNRLWGVGGTVSFHYALGAQRLFFLGARLSFLGGAEDGFNGFGGIADADFGLRPRIVTGRAGAFAFVIGGGIGGAFISDGHATTTFGFFHLAARVGPSVDLGAFALDALAGPAMLASDTGTIAALECVLDLGARF